MDDKRLLEKMKLDLEMDRSIASRSSRSSSTACGSGQEMVIRNAL